MATSSDTHTALLINRITNYMAIAFVIMALITFIALWTIRYSINRDCNNPYNRDLKIFSYWVHINAGSTKAECPTQ